MSTTRKHLYGRVSLPNGDFVKTWSAIDFQTFSKELNGGPSECVFGLGVAFDYDGADLAVGNDVELLIADADTVDGDGETDGLNAKIIYKGYISLIERDAAGNGEKVTVHVLGYYTLLAMDILKNGSQTTLYSKATDGLTVTSGSHSAADIGTMMRAVIDRYRAENTGAKIYYIDSTFEVPDTGTTADYVFEQKTYREAIDILKKLAPADVYWYINELGKLTFKTKPTTATHKFVFGKHFSQVHLESSLEKARNFLVVWDGVGGGTYKHYQDDASIALYGRRAETAVDFGIAASGAADKIGTKFLAENKDPGTKVTATILDNNGGESKGYDIESIQPGDTCSFTGFGNGVSNIFRDNMLITKVNYFLDRAVIEVEVVRSGIIDFQDQQAQQVSDINSGGLGVPTTYT